MPNIGAFELIIILVVVLLLFGSTKLPKLARSLGEAQTEFKKGVADVDASPAKAAGDEKVTMTKAELDALVAERAAEARKNAPPSA